MYVGLRGRAERSLVPGKRYDTQGWGNDIGPEGGSSCVSSMIADPIRNSWIRQKGYSHL